MIEQTPALVLGGGITALGTLRSLGRAGIPTLLASDDAGLASHSRWARLAPIPPPQSADPEDLASYLDRLGIPRAVLIPASDHYARAVAGLPTSIRQRYVASSPPLSVLDAFVDKAEFARLLGEHEVPAPRTIILDDEGTSALSFDGSTRFFLKPVDSQNFQRVFGIKAFTVADSRELGERLKVASDAGLRLIAQEYVPGPPTAHVFVDGYVDRAGQVTGILVRRRLRMEPPDFGNSSMMVSVPAGEAKDAVDSLRRLLPPVGFRGIFSAEFKEDPRDGRFRLLEVNARVWWYVEFAARCGVNVCQMAYLDALEREVPVADGYRTGVRLFYPEYDLAAFRRMRKKGELTLWPWLRSWIGAQQPICTFDDPVPGLYWASSLLRRRLIGRRKDP